MSVADASKRSGTRFYNCRCQLGPACGFSGWTKSSGATRRVLRPPVGGVTGCGGRPLGVWEQVVRKFGFDHVARVEVVTSESTAAALDVDTAADEEAAEKPDVQCSH